MFIILFKISRVSFLPETRYMNNHVGDFFVTTYLWPWVSICTLLWVLGHPQCSNGHPQRSTRHPHWCLTVWAPTSSKYGKIPKNQYDVLQESTYFRCDADRGWYNGPGTWGKMRNEYITTSGSHSLYTKAIVSASNWGKERLISFTYMALEKLQGVALARTPQPRRCFCLSPLCSVFPVITCPHGRPKAPRLG